MVLLSFFLTAIFWNITFVTDVTQLATAGVNSIWWSWFWFPCGASTLDPSHWTTRLRTKHLEATDCVWITTTGWVLSVCREVCFGSSWQSRDSGLKHSVGSWESSLVNLIEWLYLLCSNLFSDRDLVTILFAQSLWLNVMLSCPKDRWAKKYAKVSLIASNLRALFTFRDYLFALDACCYFLHLDI